CKTHHYIHRSTHKYNIHNSRYSTQSKNTSSALAVIQRTPSSVITTTTISLSPAIFARAAKVTGPKGARSETSPLAADQGRMPSVAPLPPPPPPSAPPRHRRHPITRQTTAKAMKVR
ncbi:dof zinc finger protein dof3.1, partial [Phtheirospermum japonicum]